MSTGSLLLVGGAEERNSSSPILTTFLSLCKRRSPIVLLIDAASRQPQRIRRDYERAFLELGASHVLSPRLVREEDANDESFMDNVVEADAVYFAGGDQSRLTGVLMRSRGLEFLRDRHDRGDLVVAGSSAGASALSEIMIAGGRSGLQPAKGMVDLEKGLGFVSDIVIDQHFRERNRRGRLLEAVVRLSKRQMMGIGVDEKTAVVVYRGLITTVVGAGNVVCITAPTYGHRRWCHAKPGDLLRTDDLTLTVLEPGEHRAATGIVAQRGMTG